MFPRDRGRRRRSRRGQPPRCAPGRPPPAPERRSDGSRRHPPAGRPSCDGSPWREPTPPDRRVLRVLRAGAPSSSPRALPGPRPDRPARRAVRPEAHSGAVGILARGQPPTRRRAGPRPCRLLPRRRRLDVSMPDITFDPTLFATAFVTVLVIMDPIGNIPIFLALTKGQDVADRRRAALLSSVVAGIV